MNKRYTAAISDTDILINLAKVGRLDILEKMFDKIIIPYFIYNKELRDKAKGLFYLIEQYINDSAVFEIINREDDFLINSAAKPIINDKKGVIGPGESECAGYASALKIPIIVSDNSTEFKWLSEYILLSHNNILTLCAYFKYITVEEAENVFKKINDLLTYPTSLSFDEIYTRSMRIFKKNNWDKYLGIEN